LLVFFRNINIAIPEKAPVAIAINKIPVASSSAGVRKKTIITIHARITKETEINIVKNRYFKVVTLFKHLLSWAFLNKALHPCLQPDVLPQQSAHNYLEAGTMSTVLLVIPEAWCLRHPVLLYLHEFVIFHVFVSFKYRRYPLSFMYFGRPRTSATWKYHPPIPTVLRSM
jgi:hypothetical protein